jgi:hypothetical protein
VAVLIKAFQEQYPSTQVGYLRTPDATARAIFPVAPKQTLPYANCKDCEHHMARALEPDSHERHRTVPLQETLTRIPGYPSKLVIFKIPASSYWWVRYYANQRIFKRTTKTEVKRDALEAAKRFYDDINLRLHNGSIDAPLDYNPAQVMTFAGAARLLIESEEGKYKRGQLTKISFENMQLRLNKHVLPFFGQVDVNMINYKMLDSFLQHLSGAGNGLSVSTISAYMGLVRKVLIHAARHSFIKHVPEFPNVGVEDKPRGWFTVPEYKLITSKAKKLADQTVEWRKDALTGESYFCMPGEARRGDDKMVRRVYMTRDLADLIVFMVNSYIRPTDVKNMQHGHVHVIDKEYTYLRLALPPSKGHSYPITTMPWAVRVYERLCGRRLKEQGSEAALPANEYVFMPDAPSREDAMKKLQRQFEVVLDMTGLRYSNTGEIRSLYSLRHSSIMFRLLYGRAIDTLTLARNARTSPEMIDRFYAAPLQGEMNIEMLQSRRNPRPWE